MEDKMEKKKTEEIKEKKLTAKQKEIIFTIIVLFLAIVVGIFGGKALYEAMYGPI